MERESQNLNELILRRKEESLDLEQINWLRDQINKFDEGSMEEGKISDLQGWIKENYQKIPHVTTLEDILDSKDLLREQDLRNKIKERIEELAPKNIPPPRRKINKMFK